MGSSVVQPLAPKVLQTKCHKATSSRINFHKVLED